MLTPELATAAVVMLSAGTLALYAIPDGRGCPECPHCRKEREEREQRQRELRHDLEHKGLGFCDRAPDRYRCSDDNCARNPKGTQPVSIAARAQQRASAEGRGRRRPAVAPDRRRHGGPRRRHRDPSVCVGPTTRPEGSSIMTCLAFG